MRYFVILFRFLLMCYVRWKGTKTVHEIESHKNTLGHLKGYCVRGYQLTIFCQRREYLVKYDKWYIPNYRRYTYRVMSVVTNDAPPVLKKACELDIDLPCFVSHFHFNEILVKSAVHAYLDLLEKRVGVMECA